MASSALTFVPAFDESGDDEEEQSDEDDHDPRQGVDKLGALG